jgi:hypothetical protein
MEHKECATTIAGGNNNDQAFWGTLVGSLFSNEHIIMITLHSLRTISSFLLFRKVQMHIVHGKRHDRRYECDTSRSYRNRCFRASASTGNSFGVTRLGVLRAGQRLLLRLRIPPGLLAQGWNGGNSRFPSGACFLFGIV